MSEHVTGQQLTCKTFRPQTTSSVTVFDEDLRGRSVLHVNDCPAMSSVHVGVEVGMG